jgi:hypothetical protein
MHVDEPAMDAVEPVMDVIVPVNERHETGLPVR